LCRRLGKEEERERRGRDLRRSLRERREATDLR
jgi:hypothetical protein